MRPLIAQARDRGSLSRAAQTPSARCATGWRTSPARTSRPRACTATSGAATCSAGADGGAWLVDPIAYGGHREVDLAMLRLFGAPSPRVFAAYRRGRAARRRPRGARRRSTSCFPLMIHAVLFGGGYGASAENAARRYVG